MDQSRRSRATSFGAWADEYHDSRPSYPAAAVRWLLGDARRVVEVGAGTGKLTDRLVDADHVELVVTEIDPRMLRLVSARHPALALHEAGASNLPVTDGSVDAVLVADAWQWFPRDEAAAEVRRVLGPGGWLGCVWNDPAASTPQWQWDAMQLRADIADHVRRTAPIDRLGVATGHADQAVFPWRWRLTPRRFGDYVATLSHIRTLPHAECQQVVAAAVDLASSACHADQTPTATLDLDAVCLRWRA